MEHEMAPQPPERTKAKSEVLQLPLSLSAYLRQMVAPL